MREAVERVLPVEKLRWIAFAHLEADECGAVNDLPQVAPHAQVAHGALGCMLSLKRLLYPSTKTDERRRVAGHWWGRAHAARGSGRDAACAA